MKTAEQADEAVLAMAEHFNAGMLEVLNSQLETGEELGQWASFDERLSSSLGEGDYYYTDELTAEGTQAGDIYSVCFNNYSYMGGAHPGQTYFSRTFDLSRGEYIDPLEVADDPELFRAKALDEDTILVEMIDAPSETREGLLYLYEIRGQITEEGARFLSVRQRCFAEVYPEG